MSLNGSMGLGILLEAKDLASGVLDRFGNNLKNTSNLSKDAVAAVGNHMRGLGVGLGILAAGVAGLVALSPATEAAKQYGAAIAEVTTLTDEAVFPVAKMRQVTMGLAETYGLDAIQQTKGLYQTISAGVIDATKATELLTVANKLAIGGVTDVKTTVDGLTNAVNTYAASGLTAADASDTLFVTVRDGKTTAQELADYLGHVAPIAETVGVSFSELNAALAAVTLKGISTRIATTGLKAAFENIIKPSADATAEATRLGIKFDVAALRTKGFSEFLKDMTSSAKFTKDSIPKLFGSVEALNTVLALTSNNGEAFGRVLDDMTHRTGATDTAFAKMQQTLKFQETRFEGLKKNALILIGEAIEPAEASMYKFANAMVQAFNRIPAGLREFLVKGFALASVLAIVVGGSLATVSAVGLLSTGLGALGLSFSGILAAAWPVVAVLALVVAGFLAMREAYDRNIGGIGDSIDKAFNQIHLAGAALSQVFSDGGFSGAVMEELNQADNMGIKNFVIRVYVAVARIREFLSQMAAGFFQSIDSVKPSFDGLVASLSRIGQAFSGLFEGHDSTDAQNTFKAFGSAGELVGKGIAKAVTIVMNIFTVVGDLIGGFISRLAPVGDLIGELFSSIGEVFSSLADVGTDLGFFDNAVDGSAGGWVAFGQTLGNVIGAAANIIKSILHTVTGALKGAINIIGGVLDLFTGHFEQGIQRILYGIVSLISNVILGAIELVAAASDALLGTDFAKSVNGWRQDMDKTLRQGFNIDIKENRKRDAAEEEIKAAQSFMSPEDTKDEKRQQVADAQSFFSRASIEEEDNRKIYDAQQFMAPDAFPAVAAQDAQAELMGPRVDPADVAAAAAAGAAATPITVPVNVYIGDDKVAEAVQRSQSAGDFRNGAPLMTDF